MRHDDGTRDRKAKPRSAVATGAITRAAVERIKDEFALLFGNAEPLVVNPELYTPVVCRRTNGDRSAGGLARAPQ